MRRKRLKIGLDFDGVVAYNPFRIVRAPIKWFKRRVLGINKLSFFVPKNWWQRLAWVIVHESSVLPATGVEIVKRWAESEEVEFHLITGRFGFLRENLENWLRRNALMNCFETINVNDGGEQPHLFKERVISDLKLDVYIEDNFDIVMYLQKMRGCRVMWIDNILDRNKLYADKYHKMGDALRALGL